MKRLLFAVFVAVAGLSLATVSHEVEAKRLGGGKPAGMQRQAPAKPADASPTTPATPAAQPGTNAAAAAGAAAPAAAAAGKRSWMGPLAGLAAGLGLAALFSHFGMGEGFSNVIMMVLLALVAFVAIRWMMGRFLKGGAARTAGGPQLAGAGAPFGGDIGRQEPTMQRNTLSAVPSGAAASPAGPATLSPAAPITVPGGMPTAEFERVAKQVFIRLQAANDAGNSEDLRRFTTPELFATLKADLLERGQAGQKTDVVQLDAKVVDTAEDNGQHIVSVRFQGLIREAADAGAEPFDEVWHLVRPVLGGGDWAIAGIAPTN